MFEENSRTTVVIQCLVYNHKPYLRQCLDGFIMQKTNFKFVAVVHDDCSTDGSQEIIREYEEKYPDIIKPIYEIENQYSKRDGSLMRIVNKALNAIEAKYLAFCEGDDYWIDSLKLQKQVDFLDSHADIGLCYTDYKKFYQEFGQETDSDFKLFPNKSPFCTSLEEWLVSPRYMAPPTWLSRSQLWFESLPFETVDGTLVRFTYFLSKSKVHCMEHEVTAVYRILKESASHSSSLEKLYNRYIGLFYSQIELTKIYIGNTLSKESILSQIQTKFYITYWKLVLAKGSKEQLNDLFKWNGEGLNKLSSFLFQLCRFKYARNLFRVFYLIYFKKKLGIED